MLENLAYILLFILAGYALRLAGVVDERGGRALIAVTLYIFLPALILRSMWGTSTGEVFDALLPLAAAAVATVTVLLIWWWLAVRINSDSGRAGVVVLASTFGNAGFLGYPVVLMLMGEQAMRIAVLYGLCWHILFWTLGVAVAAKFTGQAASPRQMLRGLVTHAPTWAIIIGLLMMFLGLYPPQQVTGFFDLLSDATVPVIMLSLGTFMSFRIDRGYLRPLAVVCAGKFLALPLLTLAACMLVSAGELYTATFVIQSAMPPAILLGSIVTRFKLDEEFNSNITFTTTVIGVIGIAVVAVLTGLGNT